MTVVNTNISALIGLNNIRLTNLGLKTSLARLSSGLRINWASDDPSGLAIAKGMAAQIGGARTAVSNAEDGINLIHTMDGALSETQDIMLRMRDLAVRSANDATLTSSDHLRLNSEFKSLADEITRKTTAVTFNTKSLFNRSYMNGLYLQVGPDNGTNFRITVQISTVNQTVLSVLGRGVSTAANAQGTISCVNAGINKLSNMRATLGVQERRLEHVIDDLNAQDINISAAKSRIMDADMASEISEFTRLQILQQTGTAILAQANAQPQTILQLMK